MKCLLFNYSEDDLAKIEEHYVNYHRINKNNFFFRQLMLNKDALLNIDCIRCQKFIATKKCLSQHNFLKHYVDGEKKPAEFKTIDIRKDNQIIISNINFEKHSDEYNFYNLQELVDEFLFNVKSRFKPANKVIFKADFSIENIQNAPLTLPTSFSDITNTRYWTTNVYKGVYFNDFIISEIRSNILKRVIINNLTGSSWYFNRFKHLSIKVIEQKKVIHG